MHYTAAPYGWIVMIALIGAALAAILLALKANGHRLDTATHGHSYFWGYLIGYHFIGHYSVTVPAYLVYSDLTETEVALVVGLGLMKIATGVGLIVRLREAWMAAGIMFFAEWLMNQDVGIDLGGLALMALSYLYLKKRWAEFGSVFSLVSPRSLETRPQ